MYVYAVHRFSELRSEVAKHLYDDVIPCLQWLLENTVPSGILTNGSARIPTGDNARCELGALLALSLNAADIGGSKPSTVPFLAVAQRPNIYPSRILYVGDSYENDIIGPKAAGMHTAFMLQEIIQAELLGIF